MKRRILLLILAVAFSTQASAANIVIKNNDAAGEGFNDPTAATSIPAQRGNNPGATLGAMRLKVFQEAAKVWAAILKSNVTITIGANFDPLPCTVGSGTLGQAGATGMRANFAGAQSNTGYVAALAESLAGANLNAAAVEINATFNSDLDAKDTCLGPGGFYYGLNGNVPAGMTGLFAVILHEIAHGLGFASFTALGPAGSGAFTGPGGFPDSFSRNLLDLDTGKSWDQMSNAERKASSLNEPELVWKGAQATADRGMHLGPAPEFKINTPAGIAGSFETVLGDEPTIVLPNSGVTGSVVDGNTFDDLGGLGSGPLADQAANPELADGCTQIAFGGTFTGKIVLFDKSTGCSAAIQAFFSQAEGAKAVIIAATKASGLPDVGGQVSNQEITIPYFGVEKSVGAALRTKLATANVTIKRSSTKLMGENKGKVKMHAPAPHEAGSSVSHWSTTASPHLLMEPAAEPDFTFGEVDLTEAAFKDIGWPMASATPSVPGRPTGVKATDGTSAVFTRVTWNLITTQSIGSPQTTNPASTQDNFQPELAPGPLNHVQTYRIFRCTTNAGSSCVLIGFSKTGAFNDMKGVPGTVYFYRVKACNAKCGPFSVANTGFRSTGAAAPGRPTGVKATDGTSSVFTRVTFNLVPGATGYRVFRCTTSAGTTCIVIGFPKIGTFNDRKGIIGTVYFYRVKACNATGCGLFSLFDRGSRKAVPGRPTGVRATDGKFPHLVRITWNKVTGATLYRVFRCPTKGPVCGLPIAFPLGPISDDKKGISGVQYFYRVRACTKAGTVTTCGLFSVQNPGHRGVLASAQVTAQEDVGQSAIAIPAISSHIGRWTLILLVLGFGMLLIGRGYIRHRRDMERAL